jgi:hypothetical protein
MALYRELKQLREQKCRDFFIHRDHNKEYAAFWEKLRTDFREIQKEWRETVLSQCHPETIVPAGLHTEATQYVRRKMREN